MEDSLILAALAAAGLAAPDVIRRIVDVIKELFPTILHGKGTIAVAYGVGLVVSIAGAFLGSLDFGETETYLAIVFAAFTLADLARARFEASQRIAAEARVAQLAAALEPHDIPDGNYS